VKEQKSTDVAGMTPLPEAELVVSAGRGLKGPENWGMVEELAKNLKQQLLVLVRLPICTGVHITNMLDKQE
jgi:hypothetical protein